MARAQAYDVTGGRELYRVLELHVLHEHVVQSVHVRDLLQGVQHHNKETLHTLPFSLWLTSARLLIIKELSKTILLECGDIIQISIFLMRLFGQITFHLNGSQQLKHNTDN